jgi:NhaC family Na+:H+ antiporter
MFAGAYKEKDLHPKTLSNALESAGTVTSALVPWNTCGVFIKATLGITTMTYFPYAVFNYSMPVICVVMAAMGLTLADKNGVTFRAAKKKEKSVTGVL